MSTKFNMLKTVTVIYLIIFKDCLVVVNNYILKMAWCHLQFESHIKMCIENQNFNYQNACMQKILEIENKKCLADLFILELRN